MKAWLERVRAAVPTAAAPTPAHPPEDSPEALRQELTQLIRYINRNSGRLPGESAVTARRVTDVLREIIDSSEIRPLDIHATVSVHGMVTDYLPTTLRTFLALDPSQLRVAGAGAGTPIESLQEQLESLWDSASAVLDATHAQDANALIAQGRFLRTKVSGSDLDL
jgi:hypothetical protein